MKTFSLLDLQKAVERAGGVWIGLQEPLMPGMLPVVEFSRPGSAQMLQVALDTFNGIDWDRLTVDIQNALNPPPVSFPQKEGTSMLLLEKLNSVYDTIDHLEKRGHNKAQNYRYIKSADVVRAIRQEFVRLRIYAEIDYDFVGTPYTIAREKAPNAPFSAVNVKCVALFHDLDSAQTAKGTGLGTGADTGDKAAYKAQTGALKYALKNAFLIPDEADPEADESVDEASGLSRGFEEAMTDALDDHRSPEPARPAPRTTSQVSTSPEPGSGRPATPQPELTYGQTPTPQPPPPGYVHGSSPVTAVPAPNEGRVSADPGTMPTEAEMTGFRSQFQKLGDDLSASGKLKASKGLKLNQKLLTFLLKITGATSATTITAAQWKDFFVRVETAKANPEVGLAGLAKKINQANGVEEKEK